MFKDTIRGLDKVFETDIRPPKTVLITGPPGSMKTTFCHTLMSKYLKNHPNEYAFYATLEELQADLDQWIDKYNQERPHSGRYCYGKTPMQTFLDSIELAKEKILDNTQLTTV